MGAACVLVTTQGTRAPIWPSGRCALAVCRACPRDGRNLSGPYPGFGTSQQTAFDYVPGPQPVYEMADVSPKDLDALFTYDAFSILAWTALERFGFCGQGEAARIYPRRAHRAGWGTAHEHSWWADVRGPYRGLESPGSRKLRQLRGECGERQIPNAQLIQWANAYGDSLIYRAG